MQNLMNWISLGVSFSLMFLDLFRGEKLGKCFKICISYAVE